MDDAPRLSTQKKGKGRAVSPPCRPYAAPMTFTIPQKGPAPSTPKQVRLDGGSFAAKAALAPLPVQRSKSPGTSNLQRQEQKAGSANLTLIKLAREFPKLDTETLERMAAAIGTNKRGAPSPTPSQARPAKRARSTTHGPSRLQVIVYPTTQLSVSYETLFEYINRGFVYEKSLNRATGVQPGMGGFTVKVNKIPVPEDVNLIARWIQKACPKDTPLYPCEVPQSKSFLRIDNAPCFTDATCKTKVTGRDIEE
jgi:hypothetical protein